MSALHYKNNELYIEGVSLSSIAAQYGTPCYVYSHAAIQQNWLAFDNAFAKRPHRICYAVKANSNLAILQLLANMQSGFDIVSGGELARVIKAGGDSKKIIFSGVAKQTGEIEDAIKAGIHCFNIESAAELERILHLAKHATQPVNVALRINPNIDALTHAHISTGLSENKFGIELEAIMPLCQKIQHQPHVRLIGMACHIGSQLLDLAPLTAVFTCLKETYQQLRAIGIELEHINVGGGLGITYSDENPPTITQYVNTICQQLADLPVEIIIEPGRSIIGNAGALIMRVEYIKPTSQKNFALVDGGMNDLIRPALYEAWHEILPVLQESTEAKKKYDIVGPVCESADFLGKGREMSLKAGDLLAIDTAGAYGFTMASNYNSRCRPAEVLVAGEKIHLIRRRETIEDLYAGERLL